MRTVTVEVRAEELKPADAYAAVSDLGRYADHTEAVRRVDLVGAIDGGTLSTWEVNFRNGILRWSEEDWFDESARRVRFRQTSGDFEHFAGSWTVNAASGGCKVCFEANFDLGIPSLGHIIDPIAERTLYDNVVLILQGLLGERIDVLTSAPGLAQWAPA